MSPSDRETYSRQIVRSLPSGFAFREIAHYEFGSQKQAVSLFEFDGAAFALIPGMEARLGYDANRQWEPTSQELESWQHTCRAYGFKHSIHEHLAVITLRPRMVRIGAMLVETSPREFGWETADVSSHEIKQEIQDCSPYLEKNSHVNVIRGENTIRICQDISGNVTAKICRHPKHDVLCGKLSQFGLRFPTSDEWEYLCGFGAETLFRWGDHAPCDHYAIGKKSEAFSWNLHLVPNSHGIYIAANPYKCELLDQPDLTRGGDGGFAICGGAGFFVGWLPLATAYFEDFTCKRDPDKAINPEYAVGRRVLSLN